MTENFSMSSAFPSKWLKQSDIGERDVVLTIAGPSFENVGQDQERKLCVSFRETEKKLVLNKTNAEALVRLYGDPLTNSKGMRIQLYSTEVPFGGKQTLAIRIRLTKPPAPQVTTTPPPPPPPLEPEEWVAVDEILEETE